MLRFKLRSLLALATLLTIASTTVGEESKHPAMKDPSKAKETAPATFTAKFETTKGDIEFECQRDWAPHGVDRFYNLVKIGFFNDVALFRVVKGFVVQWGIHGNPEVSKHWADANLPADAVKKSNTKGMLTYAQAGPKSAEGMTAKTRSTQLFINFSNNARLDKMGFAPICKVSKGMDVAEKFYNEYGEKVTSKQGLITKQGNPYLKENWPELDYIVKTAITKEGDKVVADDGKKSDGSSGILGDGESKEDNTTTYIIGGLLAAGVLLALMFMSNKKDEEEEEEPPRRKKRKKKIVSKKKATAKKKVSSSKKTATKKKRKKKRAKKKATE